MTDIQIPPGKYFISHSYKDADVRDKMIEQLPEGVDPYIFPPINVSPLEFVSNSLIEAILKSDGVLYINGGHSAKSFWVAFERDYALRIKLPVYRYDPSKESYQLHEDKCLDLSVFVTYDQVDSEIVNQALSFMKDERYFDFFYEHGINFTRAVEGTQTTWASLFQSGTQISHQISALEKLRQGNLAVVFWSKASSLSLNYLYSLNYIYNIVHTSVVIVTLDETPIPSFYKEKFEQEVDTDSVSSKIVQLQNRPTNHATDDLIVRLYWLIFRNQFPDLVYDN